MIDEAHREWLERRANRIEDILRHNGVQARVSGGIIFSHWVDFNVVSRNQARWVDKIPGLVGEMTTALQAECRCYRHPGGGVLIRTPRADPQPIKLLPLQRRLVRMERMPSYTAVVGLAESGSPLMVRLTATNVGNLLIAGRNSKDMLRSTVASLAMSNTRHRLSFVFIDDPARNTFGPLAGLPHLLRPVLSDARETAQALQSLVLEMSRRNGDVNQPRIAVAVSDLASLPDEAWPMLVQLVERGSQGGIHVIARTLESSANLKVCSLLRYCFPVRLVGALATPEDTMAVVGNGGVGQLCDDEFVTVVNNEVLARAHQASITPRELAVVTSEIIKRTLVTAQPGRAVTRPAQREDVEIVRAGSPELKDLPYIFWLLGKFVEYQAGRLRNYLSAKAAAQGAR